MQNSTNEPEYIEPSITPKQHRALNFDKASFFEIIDLLETAVDNMETENEDMEDVIQQFLFLRDL